MEKLPIYVDLDDVITGTIQAFIEIVRREFGKSYTRDQIRDFDLKKSFHLTQTEYEHLFEVVHRADEVLKMECIEGAVDVLSSWSEAGYPISIVTGRLTSTYEATLEWLSKHQVPYDSFTMVNKYNRAEMDMSIAVTLEQLAGHSFHLAVEDSAAMAAFLSNDMNTPVALLDRPWNRTLELNSNIKRFSGWQELQWARTVPFPESPDAEYDQKQSDN